MSEPAPQEEDAIPESSPDTIQSKDERPFVIEVLVSAGPRKSAFDYAEYPNLAELCEDSAGACWVGLRFLIFWLCDGSSGGMTLLPLPERADEPNPPPLLGFSARILAQDIGQAFVEYLCHALPNTEDISTIDVPATVFATVTSSWVKRFEDYVSRVEERGSRDKLLDALPQSNDRINRLDWASTFIGGMFDLQHDKLCIINFGDSAGFVIAPSLIPVPPNNCPVRLHGRIEPNERLVPHIELSVTPQPWKCWTGIEGFALFSDGLDRHLGLYHEHLQKQTFRSLSDLRTVILRNSKRTWDDKAVVFGRFLGN